MVFDRTQRPIVPDSHPDEREHRRLLAVRASASMPKDGTERMVAPLKMQQYATATLPDATLWEGSIVHQSDDAAPAFSDGVDWTTLATKDSVTTVASDLAALTALVATLTPRSWIIVAKTSDESRNNAGTGTTLTDDAILKFSVAANTKYRFRFSVFLTAAATPDIKFQLNGPAAPTYLNYTTFYGSAGVFDDSQNNTSYATLLTASDPDGYVIYSGILQNGANAGTVVFQWAQNTASASNTTVRAGSYVEYQTV